MSEPTPAPRPRITAIKALFFAEYVLQGLANPFQGITYQPFFTHFRMHYGLEEAAVQKLFAQSYLAWSFKPVLGFVIDAVARTRTTLIVLLSLATAFYLFTPFIDVSPLVFFWSMFVLSVVLAATDVVVDRATVVEGEAEAEASGKSKAATVGLNQAICWIAIYGTSIFAAVIGGWVAEHATVGTLLPILSLAPFSVLVIAWFLPKDNAVGIPLTQSVRNFWVGLNSGPLLWIIVFYFFFHFQPQAGALWNNYMIEELDFTQSQIGIIDGAGYFGYFIGTLAFARWGVRWQDRYGLRRAFQVFIPVSVVLGLSQFLNLDPWFTTITDALAGVLPFERADVRVGFLVVYSVLLFIVKGLIAMSTFSLVGAVVPSNAAGALFAGFMSVANVAYSFSYSTGAWLYEHGTSLDPVRAAQSAVLGIPSQPGDELSMGFLVLIGSFAYLLSFVAVQKLPDRHETHDGVHPDAIDHGRLGADRLRGINVGAVLFGLAAWAGLVFLLGQHPMGSLMLAFFGTAFVRKVVLDAWAKRL